jgi:CO/xanthine dehydrogenase FAD-binding subunit
MASYLRPVTLDGALDALESRPRLIFAGGTDVYPGRVGRPIDDDVLDLSGLPALRAITVDDGICRIPALATWTDLIRANLPARFDGLKAAALAVGGVQIQNRGTIVGNVCNASPAADGLPNLMALDARVELTSASGRREVACGEFVVGNRRTIRRPDELVTAILVPMPATDARSTFLKLGARAYLVISIAMVAAVIELGADGRIVTARVVVGACSEVPAHVAAVEARLVGRTLAETIDLAVERADVAHLAPIDDVRAPAAYRREAALVLVRRAIAELAR